MNTTALPVGEVRTISRAEAAKLASTENGRVLDLLRTLEDEDWAKPTDCDLWDVRALAGHVLGGMEGFASLREFLHQMRAGRKAAGDGPFIDGMTAVQVRERASLGRNELFDRMTFVGPRVAGARAKVPGLFRRLPLRQEVAGQTETWRMGYLLDVILTRDTWMHRVDICRATGRELVLTLEHDGRIVADVVAEWSRRHGEPFTLVLEGPSGGTFTAGIGGASITIDAVEFCRTLSGRAVASGLLSKQVPF